MIQIIRAVKHHGHFIYQFLSTILGAYIVVLAVVGTYRRHTSEFWYERTELRLQYDLLGWGLAVLAAITLIAIWSAWKHRFHIAAFFFCNVAGTSAAPMAVDFLFRPEGGTFWNAIWIEPILVTTVALVLMGNSLIYIRAANTTAQIQH